MIPVRFLTKSAKHARQFLRGESYIRFKAKDYVFGLILTTILQVLVTSVVFADKEKLKMPSQGFLEVKNEAFWQSELINSPIIDRLFGEGFKGIGLDAPSRVDISLRQSLPLIGVGAFSCNQVRGWSFRDNAVLVASNEDNFRCYVEMAMPTRRSVLRPPVSEGSSGGGGNFGFMKRAQIKAKEQLNLPWEPATYKMVLLSREWVSNPVEIWLFDGKKLKVPEPRPPLTSSGITLTASGANREAILKVKLKVRARKEIFVPTMPKGSDQFTIPLTFVILGHKYPTPYVKEVPVPVSWGSEPGAPEHVQGQLGITLGQLVTHMRDDQYYVYVFAGEEMGGPAKITVQSQ